MQRQVVSEDGGSGLTSVEVEVGPKEGTSGTLQHNWHVHVQPVTDESDCDAAEGTLLLLLLLLYYTDLTLLMFQDISIRTIRSTTSITRPIAILGTPFTVKWEISARNRFEPLICAV